MKTHELINILTSDSIRVDRYASGRRLTIGLCIAIPLSMLWMAIELGVNPKLGDYLGRPLFWVKLGAPLLMAIAGLILVMRSGQPGVPTRPIWTAWALPVAGVWLLGLLALLRAPVDEMPVLLLGESWQVCATNILKLSLPMFLAAIWTLKGMAPVHLKWAGAGAGALSGACGAVVYAIHCPEIASPFVAVWYVLGMLLPVAIGAILGPRLLRW